MAKVGAPTKLTREVHDKIVTYVRAGAYVETAAVASGVAKPTFYDWLKRGAKETAGIYREFSNAVQKAMAEAEMVDVNRIGQAAAAGVWQAAAWRLERKFPDRWGRSERHKVEHTIAKPFVIEKLDGGQVVLGVDEGEKDE